MVTFIIDKLSLQIKQEEERKEKRNIYVYNKIPMATNIIYKLVMSIKMFNVCRN